MTGLMQWFTANQTIILLVEFGVILIVLFVFIMNTMKLNKLSRMYKRLLVGQQGNNLEETLLRVLELAEGNQRRIRDLDGGLKDLEDKAKGMVQRLSIMRFNAFDNVGSDLSFAVALLNDEGTGVVISSLYGREDSRTYAKPIKHGRSTYVLTCEENKVIEQAMGES